MNNKDNMVSFLKGLGIISVVLGHVCRNAVLIVYIYHLVIFFWVSGYTYNADKYRNKMPVLFANRMHNIMPVYLGYTAIQLLLHNIFVMLGIYQTKLTLQQLLSRFGLSLAFIHNEPISPAVWFIPVSIVSAVLFGYMVEISHLISQYLKRVNEWLVLFVLVVLCGCFGIWGIEIGGIFAWSLEIAFCMVLILFTGYFYRQKNLENYAHILYAIPCGLFAYWVVTYYGYSFDLSSRNIINPIVLYPLALSGIYCCLVVERIMRKAKALYKIISFIGNYSLDIMLMHIVPVKLVDYIYLTFVTPEAGNLTTMVYSVSELWPIYTFVGVAVPVSLRMIFNISMERIRIKAERKKSNA